jgi:hypothetical protein
VESCVRYVGLGPGTNRTATSLCFNLVFQSGIFTIIFIRNAIIGLTDSEVSSSL